MICVACKKFLRTKKAGVLIEEGMPVGDDWRPYKLWYADLYRCPTCGIEVVGGFGARPIAESFQPDYDDVAARHGPRFLRVDDCGPGLLGPPPAADPRGCKVVAETASKASRRRRA